MIARVLEVGGDARLVEVDGTEEAVALAAWARERRLARDVVAGAVTVLLDGLAAGAEETLAGWRHDPRPSAAREIVVPVTYDGADLADVARQWGMTTSEVVATHTGVSFTAAFCGFAPGFAYLAGLPDDLAVSRLPTPRPVVPAGSVALAGTWCGVYPSASPGGWQLIGRTTLRLWDAATESPALLAPGTRVRFVEVP